MQLTNRDLGALKDVLAEMHAAPDDDALLAALPGYVMRVVPAGYAQVVRGDLLLARGTLRVSSWWESEPILDTSLMDRILRLLPTHPFMKVLEHTGELDAARLSDFLTARELRRTRLYAETMRPFDGGRLLAVGLFEGGRALALSLSRRLRDRDFGQRDVDMLSLLRAQLRLARRNLARRRGPWTAERRPRASFGLTPREDEVATWLARGKTNAEIGVILGMRSRTVEKHVERILAKLGVDNRTAASLALAPTEAD